MEYQKIQTVFKRDKYNIIIPNDYTKPEFKWLKDCKFRAEEKIDGTNMRVEIYIDENGNLFYEFAGRTSRAVIPTHLLEKMNNLFPQNKLYELFHDKVTSHITLYGEGYGYKIQAGGNYIPNDVSFILFDVKVDDWWLNRDTVEEIASALNIDVVPIIGYMTIAEACQYVDKGFKSTVAFNKDYNAEGLVLKTPDNLLMRNGERIILKIKSTDFRKFREKYGPLSYVLGKDGLELYTTVEQEKNNKYENS